MLLTFLVDDLFNLSLIFTHICRIESRILAVIWPRKYIPYPRRWLAFIDTIDERIIVIIRQEVTDRFSESF